MSSTSCYISTDEEDEEVRRAGGATSASAASREVECLLEEVARQHNYWYGKQLGGGLHVYFDPNQDSFQQAKSRSGSSELLEMLLQYKCSCSCCCAATNTTGSCCPRLGVIFIPPEKDNASEEEDEDVFDDEEPHHDNNNNNRFRRGGVKLECIGCFEKHAAEDALLYCWNGKDAEEYFKLKGLKQRMCRGDAEGMCKNWNEPSPFTGGYAPNQITWGALSLLDGNVWEFYLNLIERDHPSFFGRRRSCTTGRNCGGYTLLCYP